MKAFFRQIHLYLSLASGLVIATVCFTGAALVFEKEWQRTLYPERYEVQSAHGVSANRVAIESLVSELSKTEEGAKVSSVKIYSDPIRSIELSYTKEDKAEGGPAHTAGEDRSQGEKKANVAAGQGNKGEHKTGKGPGGKPEGPASQAFMNPYTGKLISLYSHRNSFFYTMFQLHRWLLAGDVGKLIVGISTSFFLFILMTGIVLWWPQNKRILQQRLKLKWTAGWKRLNHDLHIVVGFYTAIFLFAFAFTGLAWSFKWFNDGIYWITGTEQKQPEPPLSNLREDAKPISFDQALAVARQQVPNAEFYTINRAKGDSAAIMVQAMPANAIHERGTTQLFIDQYSGQTLKQIRFEDKNLGQRIRATFYPIHVGSIAGLPGRIIAFLACIAGFTFPFTGVILWINRLRKKKKTAQRTRTLQVQ